MLYIQSGALQDIPFHRHLGAGSASRRFEERLGRCFRLADLTSDERVGGSSRSRSSIGIRHDRLRCVIYDTVNGADALTVFPAHVQVTV